MNGGCSPGSNNIIFFPTRVQERTVKIIFLITTLKKKYVNSKLKIWKSNLHKLSMFFVVPIEFKEEIPPGSLFFCPTSWLTPLSIFIKQRNGGQNQQRHSVNVIAILYVDTCISVLRYISSTLISRLLILIQNLFIGNLILSNMWL